MTDVSLDELGPIDYVVVEFPAGASNFTGEMAIVTALEAGPVEVVNLMARRGAAEIELAALKAPGEWPLPAGTHLLYAARGDCRRLRSRTDTTR